MEISRSPLAESPRARMFRPLVVLPTSGCDELTEMSSSRCSATMRDFARHDNLIARIESVIMLCSGSPADLDCATGHQDRTGTACDEVVAESADERETYLAALDKFATPRSLPRLPGVPAWPTANLKERMITS